MKLVFDEMYILDVYSMAGVYMKIGRNKAFRACFIQEFGYV